MIAPGARTFLQVIYGRFGRTAHLMFCTFALLNNLYIVATIIETGNRLFSSISTEITFDLVWIVAITIAGICVNCGSLHQVFPVCLVGSGFLMLSSMAFFIGVYFFSSNPKLGSITKIYEANVVLNDLYSEKINRMSFRNWYTWILASRKFLNSLAPQFMDQATWDTCCHAVPGEESIGVFVASMLWMTLPYAFATACSNGFIALVPHRWSVDTSGFSNPLQPSVVVAKSLFGRGGLLVLFIMYAFIIANISVFQLFSISSILTFDVYAIHMKPFRVCFDVNCCLLCGKTRDGIFRPKDNCKCVPVTCCRQCQAYQMNRRKAKGSVASPCECRLHAEYLNYEKRLEIVRRSSILVIFSVVLPIGLLLNQIKGHYAPLIAGINVLVAATLGSLLYALFWERMTSAGVVIGTALSTLMAAFAWILMSTLVRSYPSLSIDPDILDIALFLVSIVGGFIFPPLVVYIERRCRGFDKEELTNLQRQSWQRIYEMDNPLSPWALEYATSFKFNNFNMKSYDRPGPDEVKRVYRRSWYFALTAAISFLILGVIIMPCVFYVLSFLDIVSFKIWIYLVLVSLTASAAVTLLMPIICEGIQVMTLSRHSLEDKKMQCQ
ncbi:putative urea active transporter 1 [Taenia crassiceps]|uniref:Urea active transporter 1 n=1 Tax=Taenia crassiceps TaxID=6207 RepID=A0ABR4QBA2_9CEST